MTMPILGRLTRRDLRDVWISEAADFTPWLARPENIAILADTLAMDLEVEAQEGRSALSAPTFSARISAPIDGC